MSKERGIVIIGAGFTGRTMAAEILVANKLYSNVVVVDLNEKVQEKQSLEEILQRGRPIKIKASPPMQEFFTDKPKKPKFNPKTGKVKY
jgi:NADH dehydrogenase FAD-containing subunit